MLLDDVSATKDNSDVTFAELTLLCGESTAPRASVVLCSLTREVLCNDVLSIASVTYVMLLDDKCIIEHDLDIIFVEAELIPFRGEFTASPPVIFCSLTHKVLPGDNFSSPYVACVMLFDDICATEHVSDVTLAELTPSHGEFTAPRASVMLLSLIHEVLLDIDLSPASVTCVTLFDDICTSEHDVGVAAGNLYVTLATLISLRSDFSAEFRPLLVEQSTASDVSLVDGELSTSASACT